MKITAIIFALLAFAAADASQAAAPAVSVSARVSTSGLDLGTPAGQASLRGRLQRAAADVCGDASSSDPAGRRAIRACRADVVARAEADLASRIGVDRLAAR